MTPNTLPRPPAGTLPPSIQRPRPGFGYGDGTFVPDCCNFGYWATLQLMVECLFSGRQQEQLRRPGSPLDGNFQLALATLFPGPSPSYTTPELLLISRSRLMWIFTLQPGMTLPGRPDSWSPFMLYVAMPLSTLQRALEQAQRTGDFVVNHFDVLGTLDQCLNLSLSPRSTVLCYTFQLSITQMQGTTYTFAEQEEICTFCPTVQQLALWLGTSRMRFWNRRYVDFLFRTSTLQLPTSHAAYLVNGLNAWFQQPQCRHFRLMHLPILQHLRPLLEDKQEGWALLEGALRSTLERRLSMPLFGTTFRQYGWVLGHLLQATFRHWCGWALKLGCCTLMGQPHTPLLGTTTLVAAH